MYPGPLVVLRYWASEDFERSAVTAAASDSLVENAMLIVFLIGKRNKKTKDDSHHRSLYLQQLTVH
jgi:hypothetical protein